MQHVRVFFPQKKNLLSPSTNSSSPDPNHAWSLLECPKSSSPSVLCPNPLPLSSHFDIATKACIIVTCKTLKLEQNNKCHEFFILTLHLNVDNCAFISLGLTKGRVQFSLSNKGALMMKSSWKSGWQFDHGLKAGLSSLFVQSSKKFFFVTQNYYQLFFLFLPIHVCSHEHLTLLLLTHNDMIATKVQFRANYLPYFLNLIFFCRFRFIVTLLSSFIEKIFLTQ